MGEDTWKPDINHIRNLIKNFNKNSSKRGDGMLD